LTGEHCGTAPACLSSAHIPLRRTSASPAARAPRLTDCAGTTRVRSKIDGGIASWPTPPVRPLRLAALRRRECSELLSKRESEVCSTNKAEGGARLASVHNISVKLRGTLSTERPASEPVAEADSATARSSTSCRARRAHLHQFTGRLATLTTLAARGEPESCRHCSTEASRRAGREAPCWRGQSHQPPRAAEPANIVVGGTAVPVSPPWTCLSL
jgi:hypothetical protein